MQTKELIVGKTVDDVRYYSDSQAVIDIAAKIRDIVTQTVINKINYKLDVNIHYSGSQNPYVPRGNIEVWIPQLPNFNQPIPQQKPPLTAPAKN